MAYDVLELNDYLKNDEEISVGVEQVNGRHPAHAHNFIEIVYIASGKGVHFIGGRPEQISKGDLFVINAGVVHAFEAQANHPLVVYNYIFQPSFVDISLKGCKNFVDVAYRYTLHTLYDDNAQDYIRLSGVQYGKLEPVLLEMHEEFEKKENGYLQVIKTDLIRLLIYIFRLYKQDNAQKQDASVYKQLVVQNAVNYMKSHYQEDIKCAELAKRSYLSTSYFNRVFKEISGMTVIEMLQNIRVNAACDLLETTDRPVHEIAAMSGYSDIKHFYNVFKRKKDCVPGEYRQRLRQSEKA